MYLILNIFYNSKKENIKVLNINEIENKSIKKLYIYYIYIYI